MFNKMPDKLVFVKRIETATATNGSKYKRVVDQDNVSWAYFLDIPIEVDRAYLFTFERNNEKGWNDLKSVKPLVNIFQQKALKEVANRETVIRNFSICVAYSKDLVVAGKIEMKDLFPYADEIYKAIQTKANEEINKLEEASK